MGLLDMCCPKKPKKSLDYVIKWVENADKRFEDIDTYLENLNAVINGDNGLYSRVSGLEVALGEKQDTLTFDTTPTINSTNPVTSGGVATALADKAAVGHSHANIYEGDNNMLSVGEGYIDIELYEVQYDELTTRNPALVKSFPITPKRTEFFKENGFTFEEKVKRLAKKTFSMKTLAYRIVRKVIPSMFVEKLKRLLR